MLQVREELVTLFMKPNPIYIYVAGNAKNMPVDVEETFVKIIEESNTSLAGSNLIPLMKKSGKYQTETWA
jgi:sulfite reductase alpha subunit-like flavoprotein